jgi:hypothetical protein
LGREPGAQIHFARGGGVKETKKNPGALAGASGAEFTGGTLWSVRPQDGKPCPRSQDLERWAWIQRNQMKGHAHTCAIDRDRLHELQRAPVRFEDFGMFSIPKIVQTRNSLAWFDEPHFLEPALIFPATDEWELIDLCAVGLETGRVGIWHGNPWCLGENELEHARRHDLPVHVFASPVAWWWCSLDRPAVCVLDWHRASFELAKHKIVAPSKRAGEILRERLALGPQVFVPGGVAA